MEKKIRKCIVCDANFKPYTLKQQCCSNECRSHSYTQSFKKKKVSENLSNYTSYCRKFGYIPYAEYQTKVLRKYGV